MGIRIETREVRIGFDGERAQRQAVAKVAITFEDNMSFKIDVPFLDEELERLDKILEEVVARGQGQLAVRLGKQS